MDITIIVAKCMVILLSFVFFLSAIWITLMYIVDKSLNDMIPKDFVTLYSPSAINIEKETGVFAITILARAAIESAWGEKAMGLNFFGIKDTDGVNGNEQLITTTEYLKSPDVKFPQIIKVIAVKTGLWKYTVKDWFRKYDKPSDSFRDFVNFLKRNPRYTNALKQTNHIDMSVEICKAGYSTDPDSIRLVKDVSNRIETLMHAA